MNKDLPLSPHNTSHVWKMQLKCVEYHEGPWGNHTYEAHRQSIVLTAHTPDPSLAWKGLGTR